MIGIVVFKCDFGSMAKYERLAMQAEHLSDKEEEK